jgi:lipopolysaccharide transport system ATP-binding protein
MNSEIVLNNVGLQFELYHNKSSSLKEMFADLFSRTHQKKNDTF